MAHSRIHGLMCIHDEADILDEVLDHILTFADAVHILDTGSIDGCWDIAQARKKADARIASLSRTNQPFTNDMRGILFERARDSFAPGDWVARLDPDEFYTPGLVAEHDPSYAASVREFLHTRVRPHEGRVFARMFEFVITQSEADELEQRGCAGVERPSACRRERLAYVTDPVPEPRFFRMRKRMRWGVGNPNPYLPGLPAVNRIPVCHYRWRSLEQIKRRFSLRKTLAQITPHGTHWSRGSWRDWLIDDADPRLKWVKSGLSEIGLCQNGHTGGPDYLTERLRGPIDTNHMAWWMKKFAQVVVYRSGLAHASDSLRRGIEDFTQDFTK